MAFPEPVTGLVIRYNYLWLREYRERREEGSKDRPCAVVLARRMDSGNEIVTVVPITHTAPKDIRYAIEIPAVTRQRLRLDDEPSWIVVNEANQFVWPGPDLRPRIGGDSSSIVYGELPAKLAGKVLNALVALLEKQQFTSVSRTE